MKRQPTYTTANLPDGSDALAGAFLASDYHDGQFTALYALASSGSLELYPGEGLARIIRELREAVEIASEHEEYAPDRNDAANLAALLAWCIAHHAPDNDS